MIDKLIGFIISGFVFWWGYSVNNLIILVISLVLFIITSIAMTGESLELEGK